MSTTITCNSSSVAPRPSACNDVLGAPVKYELTENPAMFHVAKFAPESIVETVIELPKVPGYLAITGPTKEAVEPVKYSASKTFSLVIWTAVVNVFDLAFTLSEPTTRTT